MAGLLSKIGATIPQEPGLEAVIAKQLPNDPIIKDTTDILDKLVERYKDSTLKISSSNDDIQDALDALAKVYSKRFGAPFKFDSDASFISVSEVGPMSDLGVNDIKTFISSFREEFSDEDLMQFEEFKNYIEVDRYMQANPVVIDLEKAYFKQWPKGSKILIHINIPTLIGCVVLGRNPTTVPECVDPSVMKLHMDGYTSSTKAITAMILHEIGHIFASYAYQHLSKSTRCVFEDTLKDQIRKTGDAKKALFIAYQSAYSKSSFKVKANDGVAKILINVVRSEGERYGFTGTIASSSDDEFIADQFASRFGLGAEHAALHAAFAKYGIAIVNGTRLCSICITVMWVVTMFATKLVPYLMTAGIVLGGIYTVLIASLPLVLLSMASYVTVRNEVPRYDNDLRRIERIRLDIVRQIRLYGHALPKKDLEKLIKDADDMKVIIDELVNIYPTKFKLLSGIQTLVGNAKKEDELDKYLEETMENDFHVAALRFK